jgi:hypothetical protein
MGKGRVTYIYTSIQKRENRGIMRIKLKRTMTGWPFIGVNTFSF